MNARQRLEAMVRTDRDSQTVWSPAEVRQALDAYRAEVLDEAADELQRPIPEGAPCAEWEDLIEGIEEIRGMAAEARRSAEPGMHPKDFLRLFFNIDEPKQTS